MGSITYSGSFGGNSAGADGRSTTLTGSAQPSNVEITSISYSLKMTSGGYSSSKVWRLYDFYVDDGSPYADYDEYSMSSNSTTMTGYMRNLMEASHSTQKQILLTVQRLTCGMYPLQSIIRTKLIRQQRLCRILQLMQAKV